MTDQDIERRTLERWGRNIEMLRRAYGDGGIDQAELGQLFDPPVSQSTIARWETGKAEPRIRHRMEIARIFGVPTSMLFDLPDSVAA